jgi:hypothetical protein
MAFQTDFFHEAMPPSSGEAQPRRRKNISVIGKTESFRTSGGEAALHGQRFLVSHLTEPSV